MDNIPNKTDGVDTLADSEFNSHKNELQTLVTESGQTLAIGTVDQLRKAISIYGRGLYAQDSSGAANTLTLSRPTALTDVNAYYNGMTVIFDTPNSNTGATTATFNGLASKKVLRADDSDLVVGDIVVGQTYTLVYNTALDSAAGAFELKEIGEKQWQHQATPITPSADSDYTLTALENLFGRLVLVDGSWTATHNIIVDDSERDILVDNSAGTYIATVKTSGGSGIAVAAGAKTWLLCDGTNVIESVDTGGGKVLQVVNFTTGAFASGTTQIPADDSIPQNTEGTEFMQLAITPLKATSKLKITVVCQTSSNISIQFISALFRDSGADAVVSAWQVVAGANFVSQIIYVAFVDATAAALTTFKVRNGGNAASTVYFNGRSGVRALGGSFASSITIEEIGA